MKSNNALTIGLVLDDSLDSTDGVQQYVTTLGKWLSNQGHEVHYITSETKRTDLPNLHVLSKKLRVRFNGNSGGTPLPAHPKAVRTLLKRIHFDVLHIQVPYSPFLAGQLISKASPDTIVVGTFHIFPESKLVAAATRGLGIWVGHQLQRFDRMLSVSPAAQEFCKGAYKIDSDILPNMTDVSRFLVKQKYKSKKLEIVFLGRLVERKGAMQLLKAIQYIEAHKLTDISYHVSIGGKGLLREKLEKYVLKHNLTDVVSFEGFIAEEDKAQFLAKADIAVFPSTGGESFGISLLEALAATPGTVLAGDNAGYRSVMGSFTEQLFNPYDTEAFAKLLVKHMQNSKMRQEIHKKQVAYVKQFDTPVVAQKILDVYYDALQQKRS